MLRMLDLICKRCQWVEEFMVVVGDPLPQHCSQPMEKIWLSAPTIDYKVEYSHALGRKVSSTRELDKALEKKGQWVATKAEANSTYGTDIFEDNVTIRQAREAQIRKHVEKSAAKLVADGVIPALSR